jgi:hypothetical protein
MSNDIDDVTQPFLPALASRALRYAAFTDQGSGGNPAGVPKEGRLNCSQ